MCVYLLLIYYILVVIGHVNRPTPTAYKPHGLTPNVHKTCLVHENISNTSSDYDIYVGNLFFK